MILFPDEEVVSSSDTKEVMLTTHRIIQQHMNLGSSRTKSIMLEHITSCQSQTKSYILLLIIGLGFALYSFSTGDMIGLAICLLLVLAFYYTRKSEITVSSPSATIYINTSGMSRNAIQAFIDKVEHTKHLRVKKVNKLD